jgi:glycosyltransferase involved in cell wall biosynthesis
MNNNKIKNKKCICIVSPQYLPHVGGVENYVYNFAKELISRGHTVTVVTSEFGGAPEYERDGEMEIYRLPSYSLMKGRMPVLKNNKKVREFSKEFAKKHFDAMLIMTRFYFLSLWAVKIAKKMGLRCIILDHGSAHVNTGNKFTSAIGRVYEHWITAREKRYCKEFAGCSRAVAKWIEHFKIYTDVVLYNAIDVEKFLSLKANACRDFRAEYNIPKDDLLIAFVGRLTLEKGLHLLVHAMNKVYEKRRDVHLLIAGSGYLREELEKVMCENVHFVGVIPTPEVAALLSSSNVLCLPSLSTEGFPTVILEGVVCDNYVITTSGGGAKELITDRDYGIILPENTVDALYEAIMDVADDREYREAATARCYDRVINNYTWKHTADAFLNLLEK